MTRLTRSSPADPQQPACMDRLGLLPPYSEEDVKQAYLEKVKTAHPDKGGNSAAFTQIQAAYEQALDFVNFRSNRRGWIAAQMEAYVNLQDVIGVLEHEFGAEVECEMSDWMKVSFGDFAELSNRVTTIRLHGSQRADAMIDVLVREQQALGNLRELDLTECRVSDAAVLNLRVFSRLRCLNLSQTPVTSRALQVVAYLSNLESIELDGTSVRWWSRLRLAPKLRRRARRRQSTDALSFAVRDRMRRPS